MMAKRRKNIFETNENIEKSGQADYLDDVFNGRREEKQTEKTVKPTSKKSIRHTFVIDPTFMEDLRDVVHTIKSAGQYDFAMKDAFSEMMDLYKKKVEKEYGEIKSAKKKG